MLLLFLLNVFVLGGSDLCVFQTPYCDCDDAAWTVGAVVGGGCEVCVGDFEVPGVGLVEFVCAVFCHGCEGVFAEGLVGMDEVVCWAGVGEGSDTGPGESVGRSYRGEEERHWGCSD